MLESLIVVDGYVPTAADDTNLREHALAIALDQRAFGRGQLLVAFSDRDGRFRGLAYTSQTDPPELALDACVQHLGRGAAAAVAFSDERVVEGSAPPDLSERFTVSRATAAAYGVHLVDWIACDDDLFRSSRVALSCEGEWWDVPAELNALHHPVTPSAKTGRVWPPMPLGYGASGARARPGRTRRARSD